MKSILAIIALSACAAASPLVFTSAPTETVPDMPYDTFKWDSKLVILADCKSECTEWNRFASVWKKGNKSKVVLRDNLSSVTLEIIATPEAAYLIDDENGQIECTRGAPINSIANGQLLNLEYIRSEFIDGRLADYFLDLTEDDFKNEAKKNYIWLDASTGVPLKRSGFFSMVKIPFTTYYGNLTTMVDDSEFNIPKRLACKDDSQYVHKMYQKKFGAALF